MTNVPPVLKLVPSDIDPAKDRRETVKNLGDLVDQLVERCERRREEIEQFHMAVGMSKVDYALFIARGFIFKTDGLTDTSLVDIVEKLEKYLGD
jgi:hypothetical protein